MYEGKIIYIGQTIQPLKRRLYKHKYVSKFDNLDKTKLTIFLLARVPCDANYKLDVVEQLFMNLYCGDRVYNLIEAYTGRLGI